MAKRPLPQFVLLWTCYPYELHPCDHGQANAWNQRAIRMSLCISRGDRPFVLKLAGCTLIYEGVGTRGSVTFEFPEPCQFSRDRSGGVRIVDTGATKTLLVEASQPAKAEAGATSRDCVTQIRGVIVSAKEIRLSVQTQRVAQCLPATWDDTMFHAFAARTEALPARK